MPMSEPQFVKESPVSLNPDSEEDASTLEDQFSIAQGGIAFDVTRLLTRICADHCTGIDRIDVEFLTSFHKNFKERLVLVAKTQVGYSFLTATEAETLLSHFSIINNAQEISDGQKAKTLFYFLSMGLTRPGYIHYKLRWSDLCLAKILLITLIKLAFLWWPISALRGLASRRTTVFPDPASKQNGSALQNYYMNFSHNGLPRQQKLFEKFVKQHGLSLRIYIHDLIPIEFPEFQRPGSGRSLERFLSSVIGQDGIFFTNSRHTKERLSAYWSKTHKGENIDIRTRYPTLTYLKDRRPYSRKDAIDAEPFFLHVGTIEPRKNIDLLLNVWRELSIDHGDQAPRLVLVGARGWLDETVIHTVDTSQHLRGLVDRPNRGQ